MSDDTEFSLTPSEYDRVQRAITQSDILLEGAHEMTQSLAGYRLGEIGPEARIAAVLSVAEFYVRTAASRVLEESPFYSSAAGTLQEKEERSDDSAQVITESPPMPGTCPIAVGDRLLVNTGGLSCALVSPGDIVTVEQINETSERDGVWRFNIRDPRGNRWHFNTCNIANGDLEILPQSPAPAVSVGDKFVVTTDGLSYANVHKGNVVTVFALYYSHTGLTTFASTNGEDPSHWHFTIDKIGNGLEPLKLRAGMELIAAKDCAACRAGEILTVIESDTINSDYFLVKDKGGCPFVFEVSCLGSALLVAV